MRGGRCALRTWELRTFEELRSVVHLTPKASRD